MVPELPPTPRDDDGCRCEGCDGNGDCGGGDRRDDHRHEAADRSPTKTTPLTLTRKPDHRD